ncbi:MAG: GspMb/PilO family protein [Candidatus Omnitrophota bacterium]
MKFNQLKIITDFLSKLSKREKIIFYLALLAISFTLLDKLIINPILLKIGDLNQQIKDKELQVRTSLRILAQKERIASEGTKYASYINGLKSDPEELTGILKEIENLANKSSVYLLDLKPAGLKDLGSSKKFLISLNCEGQMEQLIDFFYNIESSDKLLSIDKYQITPTSKESSIAKATLTISIMAPP